MKETWLCKTHGNLAGEERGEGISVLDACHHTWCTDKIDHEVLGEDMDKMLNIFSSNWVHSF